MSEHYRETYLIRHLDLRGSLDSLRLQSSGQMLWDVKDGYIAKSRSNIFRGLHYDQSKTPSKKLFVVIEGIVRFSFICCDSTCAKFGEVWNLVRDSEINTSVEIQSRVAVGYLTLEKSTMACFSDMPFRPEHESGINPTSITQYTKIKKNTLISDKDLSYPSYEEIFNGK